MCNWKMLKILYLSTLTILLSNSITNADVYWEDNNIHTLDNSNHIFDSVWLDSITVINPGTTVNMVDGGYVSGNLTANNNAMINMSGGTVGIDLRGHQNSTITISGGVISNNLQAFHQTHIDMSGGEVWDGAELMENSTFNMTGGYIREIQPSDSVVFTMSGGYTNILIPAEDATIYLEGDNFIVTDLQSNSTNLLAGDRLSDYGSLVQTIDSASQPIFVLEGNISGILTDGSVMDVPFRIYNMGQAEGIADIIIIPEPATFSLLALGAITLIKRRK